MAKTDDSGKIKEVRELEAKIKELEQANLVLQEYFSLTSLGGISVSQGSPYDSSHNFTGTMKVVIDLKLRKVVRSHIQNELFNLSKVNFFLKEVNFLASKVLVPSYRKKFKETVTSFYKKDITFNQSLFRLRTQSETWALVCFEKVTYPNHSNDFLQLLFILLDEKKALIDQFREFVKHSEKEEKYLKIESLTGRQREILALLGKGLTSKEIANHLNISFHTVEAHRKSIAKKTQTRKRAALISLAAEVGIEI